MLEKYKEKQFLFYKYITEVLNSSKISHAYLIETNGVSYGLELAYDMAKFLLCNGVYDEEKIKLINENIYENFYVIHSDKMIKKEQILALQNEFSFKSINGERKVYLIEDAEALNDSSANSLLKFLEEPSENIVAILVADNVNNVKNTISSRCQIINLVNSEEFDYKKIFNYCDEEDLDIEEEYDKYLNFYCDLENKGSLLLENKEIYENYCHFDQLLKFGLYLYFDLINVILDSDKKSFLPNSSKKEEILDKNSLNELIRKIDVINKFLMTEKYNVNKNLFLDNFVIKFGGEE